MTSPRTATAVLCCLGLLASSAWGQAPDATPPAGTPPAGTPPAGTPAAAPAAAPKLAPPPAPVKESTPAEQPPKQDAAVAVDAAWVAEQIKELEAAATPENPRDKELAALNAAKEAFAAADRLKEQQRQTSETVKNLPQLVKELQDKLAAPRPEAPKPPPGEVATVLAERKSGLDTARQRLEQLQNEERQRNERELRFGEQLSEAGEKLRQMEAELAKAGPVPPAQPQARAEWAKLHARRDEVKAGIAATTAERTLQGAGRDWQDLKLRQARREVETLQQEVAAAEAAARQLRVAEEAKAEQRAAAARGAAVEEYAGRIASFDALVEGVKESSEELGHNNAELRAIEQDLANTQTEVNRREAEAEAMQESVENALKRGTLSSRLIVDLRRQKARYGGLDAINRRIQQRQDRLVELQNRKDELSRRLLELPEPDRTVDELLTELPAGDRAAAEPVLTKVVEDYVANLRLLQRSQQSAWNSLIELDEADLKLRDVVRQHYAFIVEHILWVRSDEPLRVRDFPAALRGLLGLVQPAVWRQLAEGLLADAWRAPLSWLLALAVVVSLVTLRSRLVRRMKKQGEIAAGRYVIRMRPTLLAALWTLLVVLVWPLLPAVLGWRLRELAYSQFGDSGDPADRAAAAFALSVGAALQMISWAILTLELLRQLCRDRGLVEAHFGGAPAPLRRVRKATRSLIVLGLPLVFLIAVAPGLVEQTPPQDVARIAELSSLARVAFLLGMAVLAWCLHQTKDPASGLFDPLPVGQADGWLHRLSRAAYPLALLLPLVLAGLAAWGYTYTALQMGDRIEKTLWFAIGLWVLRAVVIRYMLLSRKRLQIELARQKWAAAQEARRREQEGKGETPTISEAPTSLAPEGEVDLTAIDAQSRTLLGVFVLALGVFGLVLVWHDVLPAINALRDVTVLSVALPDLLGALLIGAVTFVAGKNVPGLLELAVLPRLPMDAGARYATATLAKYAIFLIGALALFRNLGWDWSSIQFLAAALSVGLGFGLQEILANFVSGLILLFERPIRVGDIVTVDDVTGQVTRIRIRATTIKNWDRKDLVIPNKEFITGRVMNWTLTDQVQRIVLEVGVAYVSDIPSVRELLQQACRETPAVLADPAPLVVCENFGDNALQFVIRAYVGSIDHLLGTRHELTGAVHRVLADAGVEISFPQRDLHLRSVDPKVRQALAAADHEPSARFGQNGSTTERQIR